MKKTIIATIICGTFLAGWARPSRALSPEMDQSTASATGDISLQDLRAATLTSLKELGEAYSQKRRGAFMRLVSDDFQGDLMAFEDAVLKDFRQYRDVNLDFIPDYVTVHGKDAEVTFRYNLSVVDNQGTQTLYRGESSYTFKLEKDKMKLARMAQPILFGNSLPAVENPIATPQGPATADPGTAPGDSAGTTVMTGAGVLTQGVSGFRFSSESNVSEGSADLIIFGGSGQGVEVNFGGGLESLGTGSLSSVTSVPANPAAQFVDPVQAGDLVAVKTLDGKYAVIRITAVVPSATISFEYKYQSNGSTSF